MKIVLCIERWLFLFFGFYSLINECVYVVFADFHIVLPRLDLIKWFLPVFFLSIKTKNSNYIYPYSFYINIHIYAIIHIFVKIQISRYETA